MQGYGNLCRLISRLQAGARREAALARGRLPGRPGGHAEGLLALSGGHAGPLDACLARRIPPSAESTARELAAVGRDRFFIELQIVQAGDADMAAALQSLADRLRLRTVATHDIHYLSSADAPRYRVLGRDTRGRRLGGFAPPARPVFSCGRRAATRRFAGFPRARQTGRVAEASRFEFPLANGISRRSRKACRRDHDTRELWTGSARGARGAMAS